MLREKIGEKISFYLDDLATPVGKLINTFIAILVLTSAISFVAQTYDISEITRHRLNSLDQIILIIFVLEYFLRLAVAKQKIKYFFSLYAIIDLVAILPFFLGSMDVAFIRLLRWFRILRLIRIVESRSLFVNKTEDIAILFRILFTLLAIVFIFSGLVYQIEHISNPKFHNFLDAFYFSIFTMTTVGYSDVMPISDAGKLTTVLMVLTGIALIPVQLGELFKRLIKTANQNELNNEIRNEVRQESACPSCGLAFHDADAKFCKICGTML
ncbi:MAG: Ion transporter [Pseudanabaena sp.]|nr:MAG: Ion transporter [Pseudanabaena sp.]